MSIIAGFVVPHPPVILPEIGNGDEKAIRETTDAYLEVAKKIAELKPETIIISSPHAEAYSDYFQLSEGEIGIGNFARFRAPQVSFRVFYDQEMTQEISALALAEGFPAGCQGQQEHDLDHGTMIPLYFINKFYRDYKLVRTGLSGLPLIDHYHYGSLMKQSAEILGRRCVFVASGDLSHCQKADGPYGFHKEGPEYDQMLIDALKGGRFADLFDFDPILMERAEECGHRSFVILAGALDKEAVKSTLLSHQNTFGVGYGVASFEVIGEDYSRNFGELYLEKAKVSANEKKAKADPFVSLAWNALEEYLIHGHIIGADPYLPDELSKRQAGVFVSIHKFGDLRGCIGTFAPVTKNVASEIIRNAISAASEDPRFPAIKAKELPYLEVSVDVLSPRERILSVTDLNPKRYGVIVEKGNKRGLLLPDLPGVDSAEEQIKIAKQKAGLSPEDEVALYRFEVARHQ